MAQAIQRGDYPADWKAISEAVKAQAGRMCERCGKGPYPPGCGGGYGTHHFDGDKCNCQRWNLMALCNRCHLSVQARVDPARPYLYDPSPWALPHIAGYHESGFGVPGPTYDLARWVRLYEEQMARPWPAWAPRPEGWPEAVRWVRVHVTPCPVCGRHHPGQGGAYFGPACPAGAACCTAEAIPRCPAGHRMTPVNGGRTGWTCQHGCATYPAFT